MTPTRYLVRGTIAPAFVDAHALSADDAIAFAPRDARETKAFAAMILDGSIRRSVTGRFYFDYAAYQAAAAARSRRMIPVWLIGALLIAAVALLFYRG